MLERAETASGDSLARFLPSEVWPLRDHQTDLPRIARTPKLTAVIASRLREIPTSHQLYHDDAREMSFLEIGRAHV